MAAISGNAHDASNDAFHFAIVAIDHVRGGKAREHFNAEIFSFLSEPAGHIGQRSGEIAVVLHIARHWQPGDIHRALRSKPDKLVAGDFGLQRAIIALAPVRDQRIKANRVHHDT